MERADQTDFHLDVMKCLKPFEANEPLNSMPPASAGGWGPAEVGGMEEEEEKKEEEEKEEIITALRLSCVCVCVCVCVWCSSVSAHA